MTFVCGMLIEWHSGWRARAQHWVSRIRYHGDCHGSQPCESRVSTINPFLCFPHLFFLHDLNKSFFVWLEVSKCVSTVNIPRHWLLWHQRYIGPEFPFSQCLNGRSAVMNSSGQWNLRSFTVDLEFVQAKLVWVVNGSFQDYLQIPEHLHFVGCCSNLDAHFPHVFAGPGS